MASVVSCVVVLILVFVCVTNAYNADADNQYHLFTRRNPTISQPLLYGNADIMAASNYDPRLRTIVSIHGGGGSAVDDYNANIIPAYLASDDVNMIVVDWHEGSLLRPDGVVESALSVARFINWLQFFTGRPAENFHVVSFSLGVHHAGITCRHVEGGVSYITALDPSAGGVTSENRFQPDDGLYTEVIYTSAGGVAYSGNLGHVNFYPNGGTNMPGCGTDIYCNHARAYFYLAEALVYGGFTGTECASYEDAVAGNCNLPGRHQIGGRLPSIGLKGTYFLRTNAAPPFSIY